MAMKANPPHFVTLGWETYRMLEWMKCMVFVAAHADENLQIPAQRAYTRGSQLDEHPDKIG